MANILEKTEDKHMRIWNISVIIPTYNRAEMLKGALRSVLKQSGHGFSFQIIVVDDGSNDNTEDVVTEICRNNNSRHTFLYIKNNKCRGATFSRNKGLTSATGELVAFLDDDDEWLPYKTVCQLAIFQKNQNNDSMAGVCSGRYNMENGIGIAWKPVSTTFVQQYNYVCTSSVLLRKNVFCNTDNFNEQYILSSDWEMWIRITARKNEIYYIPDSLVVYNIHEGNSSKRTEAVLYDCEKMFTRYKIYPKLFMRDFWQLFQLYGEALREIGQLVAGRRMLWYAFKVNPCPHTFKRYICSLLSFNL
jgi:glycosyltransferase involved in cell wall biosynthesis